MIDLAKLGSFADLMYIFTGQSEVATKDLGGARYVDRMTYDSRCMVETGIVVRGLIQSLDGIRLNVDCLLVARRLLDIVISGGKDDVRKDTRQRPFAILQFP